MHTFIRLVFTLAIASSLAFSTGCNSSNTPLKPRLESWTADASHAAKLGEEVEVYGVKISPPKGFQAVEEGGGPNGAKLMGWVGQTRNDGSAAAIQLMVVAIPETEKAPSVAGALEKLLGGVKRNRDSWQQGAVEIGLINGVEFARTKWTAFEPSTMNPMNGYMYVAIDDGKIYQLATQDIAMYRDTELETSNAALLSFKK